MCCFCTDPSNAQDIPEEDFLCDLEEEAKDEAKVDPQPPPPAGRAAEERRFRAVELELGGLHLESENGGSMIIYHHYDWLEAVTDASEADGCQRKKRLTVDVLLPGPTTVEQIAVTVDRESDPTYRTLKYEYKPPSTYLSAKRTAIRGADIAGVPAGNINDETVEQLSAMSRVIGHEEVLEGSIHEKQKVITHNISLPFAVEPAFTSRNDWGREGQAAGLSVCMYRHDDEELNNNNQLVWILHIEMCAAERAIKQTPTKPSAYAYLAGLA